MTVCTDCAAARITSGAHRFYNNRGCIYCAARLLQSIGRLPIGRLAITIRRKAMLAESVAAGLNEQRIRELVKGGMAVEPITKEKT